MAEELACSVKSLSPEEQKEAIAKYPGIRKGFVKVGEGNHLLPTHCIKHLHKYSNFRFRHDDVLIMTFPRSGTTWTQEIIWTMRNGLNFHEAETIPLMFRSPFMEFDSLHAPELPFSSSVRERFLARHPDQDPAQSAIFLDIAEGASSPRTLKTHMPFCLFNDDLLDTCKATACTHLCTSYMIGYSLYTFVYIIYDRLQLVHVAYVLPHPRQLLVPSCT
ncbi:luciferin sulfotransferase-like [Panulirus ornatus]|uniref:luciferin sulfotransferase-like n=1 Tax=Panulirus ornatus TaxID=150431 RepID=UPI003A895AF2